MHAKTKGLVLRSNLFLSQNEDEKRHPYYDSTKDAVFSALRSRGFELDPNVQGDLPLSHGFASSSVLTFMFLRGQTTRHFVDRIDEGIHGFTPSGVDSESCFRQSHGFFGLGHWTSVDLNVPHYRLLIPSRERIKTLAEIRTRITGVMARLQHIADCISTPILGGGGFDFDSFMDYCQLLVEAKVYSNTAESFISQQLQMGIAAKGIGGIYDKAILVMPERPNADLDSHLAQALSNPKFKGYSILSDSHPTTNGIPS
jgi:hypothetical protein